MQYLLKENENHSHLIDIQIMPTRINLERQNTFILKTQTATWAIPAHYDFLKLLIDKETIYPQDMKFDSEVEFKQVVQRIFLLATVDELNNQQPSSLAQFARQITFPYSNKHQH